jgi:hypothetical protein
MAQKERCILVLLSQLRNDFRNKVDKGQAMGWEMGRETAFIAGLKTGACPGVW